jgi:hypothetical protein
LKNDNGETIAFENINPVEGEIESILHDKNDCNLILLSDYIKKETEAKIKSELLIAQKKQQALIKKRNEQIAYEKRKEEFINKFGQQYGDLIALHKVQIGMSKEMCRYSWGEPLWIDKTTTETGIYEHSYYWLGYSLHFVNGVLKRSEE